MNLVWLNRQIRQTIIIYSAECILRSISKIFTNHNVHLYGNVIIDQSNVVPDFIIDQSDVVT